MLSIPILICSSIFSIIPCKSFQIDVYIYSDMWYIRYNIFELKYNQNFNVWKDLGAISSLISYHIFDWWFIVNSILKCHQMPEHNRSAMMSCIGVIFAKKLEREEFLFLRRSPKTIHKRILLYQWCIESATIVIYMQYS